MKTHISITCHLQKVIFLLAMSALLSTLSSHANAEVIDPENHIKKNGYHSVKMGDDGKTSFYSYTERAKSPRITALENDISKLPKHIEVQKMCDFMRGGVKTTLIEQQGISFDVAVTNYGYSGATIACVLKYMHENNVGTQLIYSKKGDGGMYMLFVTD